MQDVTPMSFSVYNQLNSLTDYTYKLIQLPKSLVAYLRNETGRPLKFKAPTNVKTHLAICTEDQTYNVRQMNHSNAQLLTNDMAINKLELSLEHTAKESKCLLGIGQTSYLYELSEADGYIAIDDLPVYDGPGTDLLKAKKTLKEVCNDSPIAPGCFQTSWYDLSGSEINGRAVLLSPRIVTEILHIIISLMIAEDSENFDLFGMSEKVKDHNAHFTKEVVITVAHKFGQVNNEIVALNAERVAKWFGVETLRNLKSTLSEKDLLLSWKASLPPFYNVSLDTKQLLGHYCRPSQGQIRYLRPESLSDNLHERIKEMFQVVKEWDYDEFLPYVQGFVPASKKADNVILKYARKKRQGKKFVVCPR